MPREVDVIKSARLRWELDNHIETIRETDALDVLVLLAGRLAAGHRAYGALNLRADSRSWPRERLAESLDRVIYTAFDDLAAVWKREEEER